MNIKKNFQENPQYFGKELTPVINVLANRLPPGGRIFDVGAGQGRNALLLAQRGFVVDAIDGVELGMRQLREQANKLGLENIHEHVGKIEEMVLPPDAYDGFCFINSLHFSSPDTRREIIQRAQQATKKDGYHAITVWSDAPTTLIHDMRLCLATEEEMRELYSSWSIEGCKTVDTLLRLTDPAGAPYPVKVVVLLAKNAR